MPKKGWHMLRCNSNTSTVEIEMVKNIYYFFIQTFSPFMIVGID